MVSARYFVFGRYRLDSLEGRLWRDATAVPLTRKAHGMLAHLVAHAGELLTKDDLLEAVWPRTVVVEGVLTTVVRELRRALDDPARNPLFIQTVHRQGYRFIAPVTACDALPAASHGGASRLFVGRETEWRRLQDSFASAFNGTRQVVFLAGEAGIGKTATIDELVAHLAAQSSLISMRGQCIEHYGMGEAYLPILEALGRLGRDHASLRDILVRYAPSWLAHLPSLQSTAPPPQPSPVTSTRMLRELSEALEHLATHRPVIFVLEDLHWSDTATLDWLAHFARRRDPARLLLLATYRPVDVIVHAHPLRSVVGELQRQDRCTQLLLDYLSLTALEEYLQRRFPGLSTTAELAELLHRRTSGQPLFFVTIIEALLREQLLVCNDGQWRVRGSLAEIADVLPATASQLVEREFETLPEEDQTILEAAGVAGESFSVALLASACGLSEEQVEARSERWVRQHRFLLSAGTDAAARFRFRHAVFQDAVYRRIPSVRRARLHRAIGDALVRAHRSDTTAIAAEAAVHFERGGDVASAVSYLEQAADRAMNRSAYGEALAHARGALALSSDCPESADLTAQRARLQLCLATALRATKGWADEEVEQAHQQAKELCARVGDTTRVIGALWGLICVRVVRAELQETRVLSEQLLELTRNNHQVPFQLAARMELAGAAFSIGDFVLADREFALGDALYDPAQHREHLLHSGCDQGVFLRSWWSHLCWRRGDNARALALSNNALALSHSFGHPLTSAIALAYAAILRQFMHNVAAAEELANQTLTLCTEHGFTYYRTWGQIVASWCRTSAPAESAAQIAECIQSLMAARTRRALPYFYALLAETHLRAGNYKAADAAISAGLALAQTTGECWWVTELQRFERPVAIAR
jgi:DNA-binding winged helix-turn-helix (wHTH) protein/tetratricopeptide (TPR) repeat protein